MQSTRYPFGENVVPHPPGAVGTIAGEEAGANLRAQLFVTPAAPTARSCQPGIEPTPRDTERPAQPPRRPDPPVLRDEGELHVDSFAKYAAAFFRTSRSAFSLITSRLSCAISSCSGFICPWPGNACCGSPASAFTQPRNCD